MPTVILSEAKDLCALLAAPHRPLPFQNLTRELQLQNAKVPL